MSIASKISSKLNFHPTHLALPALTLLAFAARYLPKSWPGEDVRPIFNTMLLDNIASLVLAGMLLASALGLGAFLQEKIRAAGGAIQSVALGLGAYSLVIFITGNIIVNDYIFLLMLLAPQIIFAGRIHRLLAELRANIEQFAAAKSYFAGFLVLMIALLFVLNLVRAYLPPHEYDVLEYHLGAPARYMQEGRIRFLPENVYAAFPFNMEMLYLMALGLKGDLMAGGAFAQVINVTFGLLAALAAGSLARKAAYTPMAALIAAAAFYAFPWTFHLSTLAYVEPGTIFFAILSIAAAVDAVQLRESRSVVLAGIFAGLSAGCKYPAVLFLIIPVATGLVVVHALGGTAKAGMRHAILFCAVSAAVLSPWLIRNAIDTGNPTYPLMYNVFGGRYWSDYQNDKWNPAHRPDEFSLRSLIRSAHRFLHEPEVRQPDSGTKRGSGLAWLPVAAGVLFISRKDKLSITLILYLVAVFVFWYFFTHRIARFIAPWAMIAIVPAAVNATRLLARSRAVAYVAIGASVMFMAGYSQQQRIVNRGIFSIELFNAMGLFDQHYLLTSMTETGSNFNYSMMQAINALPENTRTLFVGEAQTYYVKRDFVMATVFDHNPMEGILRQARDADEIHRELRALGITHIYVNIPEIRRLRTTYAFEYGKRPNVRVPSYWDVPASAWPLMSEFFRQHCEGVYEAGKPVYAGSFMEEDRPLFEAFTGGRIMKDARGHRFLPHAHFLYRLK